MTTKQELKKARADSKFTTASGRNEDPDTEIELFKLRRLVKTLESARGNGTSMISLFLTATDDVHRV